ncbi:MAG: flagellar biosynthesis chaperone [Syntrophus sp. PtaU1.Bin005]|jgi:flagellar FliJ protein|uniref:flagellar export protein FliJ n=1 Tax=Syntrophus TaxID=43773 RepID=UPI0009CE70BC|nr:MAG: flagellar biosynthesis chaperone [Syntrophus sp. PtaB.Bin138]OPY81286.1 MAG: flagellar biosynthesis chaperone [Syntrophus sp. PtaU1.Bin005]
MFKFPLQTVLEYRTILEERMLIRFSEAVRRMEKEQKRLDALVQKRADLVGTLKGLQESRTSVEKIAILFRGIETLHEEEKGQRGILSEASVEVEAKRQDLLEAVKKRKMLETLREKNLEDYERSLADLDRKVMDEMGILRFDGAES